MRGVQYRADVCIVAICLVDATELSPIGAFLRTAYTGRLAIRGICMDEGIWIEQLELIKVVCRKGGDEFLEERAELGAGRSMLRRKSSALVRAKPCDDGQLFCAARTNKIPPQIQGQIGDDASGTINNGLEGPSHGCVVHGVHRERRLDEMLNGERIKRPAVGVRVELIELSNAARM